MNNRLLNLYRANAKRGTFRAEASAAGNVIEIFDVIISSEIDAEWFGGVAAPTVARALASMSGTVHMRINSPGGDVFAGVQIAQAMREYAGEIIVHVDGYAASIASIVAIAGDKVIMAPGSMMMIHKAWTWGVGNADDFLSTAALLEQIDGQLVEAYVKRSAGKKDADEFAELIRAEKWFTPQEAIDAGLADEIAPEKSKTANQARAMWDVSAFDKAPPADHAPPAPGSPESDHAAAAAAAEVMAAAKAAAESERQQRARALRLLAPAA